MHLTTAEEVEVHNDTLSNTVKQAETIMYAGRKKHLPLETLLQEEEEEEKREMEELERELQLLGYCLICEILKFHVFAEGL
jgi:hypothetical protein